MPYQEILSLSEFTKLLLEFGIAKALETAYNNNKKIVSKNTNEQAQLNTSNEDLEKAVNDECIKMFDWYYHVRDSQFNISNHLPNIFVNLDVYLTPSYNWSSKTEKEQKVKYNEILSSIDDNIVIFGHTGAGKTTLMKKICETTIQRYSLDKRFPIVVVLRDLDKAIRNTNNQLFLFKYLADKYKIEIKINELGVNTDSDVIRRTTRECVLSFLNELGALLILDGFDEIVEFQKRQLLKEEFLFLTENSARFRVILSTRLGEFTIQGNLSCYELAPLGRHEIDEFALKYFDNDEAMASIFGDQLEDINKGDLMSRPLTLAFCCYHFIKYGYIPDQPSVLYGHITDLLFTEWSNQQSVIRVSKFPRFHTNVKRRFVSHFAYELTTRYKTLSFNKLIFENIFNSLPAIYFDTDIDAHEVLNEIQSHTSIIISENRQEYTFAHKSIQEFLAAEYIVRLPTVPKFNVKNVPNELAIAIALSSQPNDYFYNLAKVHRDINLPTFFPVLLERLKLEKPRFSVDPILGLAIVIIYNSLKRITINDRIRKPYIHLTDRALMNNESKIIFDFFEEKVIQDSVLLLLLTSYPENRGKRYQEEDSDLIFFKLAGNFDNIEALSPPRYIAISHRLLTIIKGS